MKTEHHKRIQNEVLGPRMPQEPPASRAAIVGLGLAILMAWMGFLAALDQLVIRPLVDKYITPVVMAQGK